MEEQSLNKHKVILELLGIPKKWVRHNGEWVDMSLVNERKTTVIDHSFNELEDKPRKWWKFWTR